MAPGHCYTYKVRVPVGCYCFRPGRTGATPTPFDAACAYELVFGVGF
jgi:hypothetical protein